MILKSELTDDERSELERFHESLPEQFPPLGGELDGYYIVSKAQASDWAHDALPQWRRHIDLARKSYARQATPEDRQFMLTGIERFLEFAQARIERAGEEYVASALLLLAGQAIGGGICAANEKCLISL